MLDTNNGGLNDVLSYIVTIFGENEFVSIDEQDCSALLDLKMRYLNLAPFACSFPLTRARVLRHTLQIPTVGTIARATLDHYFVFLRSGQHRSTPGFKGHYSGGYKQSKANKMKRITGIRIEWHGMQTK